jgi:NAD(P)-dependent dehydrogenase (short-subunit alcohol dehydrogenase family)
VLVTGGTMGIGLATALAFGRRGARCWLTYRWGSADEAAVRAEFARQGAPEPRLVQADVACADDTAALLDAVAAEHERVDVLVSNVAVAGIVREIDDLALRGLTRSIEYSAWPLVEYSLRIRCRLGSYPRYVLGLSSIGPDAVTPGYDFVAASKAVLETLARYLAHRLGTEGVRVNVIRSSMVKTASSSALFGERLAAWEQRLGPDSLIRPEEVADTAVALCGGLMDAVNGQVITVDRGRSFTSYFWELLDQPLPRVGGTVG